MNVGEIIFMCVCLILPAILLLTYLPHFLPRQLLQETEHLHSFLVGDILYEGGRERVCVKARVFSHLFCCLPHDCASIPT